MFLEMAFCVNYDYCATLDVANEAIQLLLYRSSIWLLKTYWLQLNRTAETTQSNSEFSTCYCKRILHIEQNQ